MKLAAALTLALLAAPVRAQEEGAGEGLPVQLRMGGLLLYNNSRAPMSLVTLPVRPKDTADAGELKAESCQKGLAIPIAASLRPTSISGSIGNGGFAQVLEKIKKEHPDLKGIYDVRSDVRLFSILGIYRKLCVQLTARGFR